MDAPKLIIMGTVAAALLLTRNVRQPVRTLLAYGALAVLGMTRVIPLCTPQRKPTPRSYGPRC